MNMYVTKKLGEYEVTLSVEVDENSPNAAVAFEQMHRLFDNFGDVEAEENAPSERP